MEAAALSSPARTDLWCTPKWLIERVIYLFGPIDLDVCAHGSTTIGRENMRAEDGKDGLALPWSMSGGGPSSLAWCNPPYRRGQIGRWLLKGHEELLARHCERALFLVPAATDTEWWHEYVMPYATAVWVLHGRVKFDGPKVGSPAFSSVLVDFRAPKRGIGSRADGSLPPLAMLPFCAASRGYA